MFELNSQTPFQLRNETRSINVSTTRSGTDITIKWNIPAPLNGDTSSFRAYNGVVIIASKAPFYASLEDGKKYEADPTVSDSLHAGDKIGDLLVVGAFYNDTTTVQLVVTDCIETQPYFFHLFPVDKEFRYDDIGVASYELLLQQKDDLFKSSQGFQKFNLYGKLASDNITYYGSPTSVTLKINAEGIIYTITYNTSSVVTYNDLINYINNFFKSETADYTSTLPYNQNSLWFKNNKLFKWDGYEFQLQTLNIQTTQPHSMNVGDYWLNGSVLKIWNGASWTTTPFTSFSSGPENIPTDSVWFDGTDAYKWNSTYWLPTDILVQNTDPHATPFVDGVYWLNNNSLYFITANVLQPQTAIVSDVDPMTPSTNDFWVNIKDKQLKQYNGSSWINKPVTFGKGCDLSTVTTQYYYDTVTHQLFDTILDTELTNFVVWNSDPTLLPTNTLWLNGNSLFIRLDNMWKPLSLSTSPTNPTLPAVIPFGMLWFNPDTSQMNKWIGNVWEKIDYIDSTTDPLVFVNNTSLWYNTTNGKLYKLQGTWVEQTPVYRTATDPSQATIGEFWMNGTTLTVWNGIAYVPVVYSTTSPAPSYGFVWYNSNDNNLYQWNGSSYVAIDPIVKVTWDAGLVFTDTKYGSDSYVCVLEYSPLDGSLNDPILGNDAVSRTPMQYETNIGGNDGSIDERLYIIDSLKRRLGYPIMVAELSDQQINDAIDRALRVLRLRSSVAYNRMVTLMEMRPNVSTYVLSNRKLGYHKITDIMAVYRLPSSFLTAVGSQQIYGQLVLQQLYQAGTFDLVSYHLISSYIKMLEKMFASKITYNWRERTRELVVYNTTGRNEIVLLDVIVERTENDLFNDRRLQDWIERYALSECREMLADIRGKFGSLPGPNGGISLNASEMRETARQEKEQCFAELQSFIVEQPEEFGGYSTFIVG